MKSLNAPLSAKDLQLVYDHGIFYGGAAAIGFLLLLIFAGRRLRRCDYFFGVWSMIGLITHAGLDGYFLYTPRLLPIRKNVTEPVPKDDDYVGQFVVHVRKMWREMAEADTRMYMDEFQPLLLTTTWGLAIGGSILCLLTFLGYLTGGRWTHPFQIMASTWQVGLLYTYGMSEYFDGFKHTKDIRMFFGCALLFAVMPILAILHSLCKICGCCNRCPFSKPEPKPEESEKKWQ